jgi:hypothetical protein
MSHRSNQKRVRSIDTHDVDETERREPLQPPALPPVTRLPADLFRHICTFLPPLRGPCALARVSRDWNRLAKTISMVRTLHDLYRFSKLDAEIIMRAHAGRQLIEAAAENLADKQIRATSWLEERKCSGSLVKRYREFFESVQVLSVTHTSDSVGNAVLRVRTRHGFCTLRLSWSTVSEVGLRGKYHRQYCFTLSTSAEQMAFRIEDNHEYESVNETCLDMTVLTTWLVYHGILLDTDSANAQELFKHALLDNFFSVLVHGDVDWYSLKDREEDNDEGDDEY